MLYLLLASFLLLLLLWLLDIRSFILSEEFATVVGMLIKVLNDWWWGLVNLVELLCDKLTVHVLEEMARLCWHQLVSLISDLDLVFLEILIEPFNFWGDSLFERSKLLKDSLSARWLLMFQFRLDWLLLALLNLIQVRVELCARVWRQTLRIKDGLWRRILLISRGFCSLISALTFHDR